MTHIYGQLINPVRMAHQVIREEIWPIESKNALREAKKIKQILKLAVIVALAEVQSIGQFIFMN